MKRLPLFAILVLLLSVVVGGLSAQDEPQEGGQLNFAVNAVTGLDPVFIADDFSFRIASLIFSTLTSEWVAPDGTLETIPNLAESWEISEDGKTVIFNLRRGMMFHDGNAVFPEGESREVVADDVVYSFNRAFETEGSAAITNDLAAVFESVEALDDYTVQLNMSAPNGLLFNAGRGISKIAIYPQEAVEFFGDDFTNNPIGSGPFKFVEYVPDDRVVLTRNEDYYIRPLLDGIVFRIIPDDNTAVIALETGQVDVIGAVPPLDLARLESDPAFSAHQGICPIAQQFIFNMAVDLFQDIRMRQAIAFAYDYDGIGRVSQRDAYVNFCGFAGPGVPGYNPDLCTDLFQHDPDMSAALLSEMGYEDTNGNGIVDLDGQDLIVPILVWNLPEMPRVGEALVSELNRAGIGTSLEVVEFGTWIDKFFGAEEYLFGFTGFCGVGGTIDFLGQNSVFADSMSIENEARAMLSAAVQIYDLEERGEVVREAARMIYEDYVLLPAGAYNSFYAYNNRVQDFPTLSWWLNLVTERSNTWISN